MILVAFAVGALALWKIAFTLSEWMVDAMFGWTGDLPF